MRMFEHQEQLLPDLVQVKDESAIAGALQTMPPQGIHLVLWRGEADWTQQGVKDLILRYLPSHLKMSFQIKPLMGAVPLKFEQGEVLHRKIVGAAIVSIN
jgi:hypothetical protein